jgi:transposase
VKANGPEKAPPQDRNLERENERLRRDNERLRQENERLREELDKALRAAKRQAAPFSRGAPKKNPQRPGRKPGKRYGKHRRRTKPEQVEETIAVPLPAQCPCGGEIEFERTEAQYQEDIVRQTVRRRFDIAIGRCGCCGRRAQGRDPRQTSDALGAASVQIGPEALALAAVMTKQMGLSLGHVRQVLATGFGLEVTPSGLSRALGRMAAKAEPTYAGLQRAAQGSGANYMDETGWKVGGKLQWAHVAVGEQTTLYAILPGRGFEQSCQLVGSGYRGFLGHDGWAPYYKFEQALHQSCLAHLIRRCKEMEQTAGAAARRFPWRVKELLQKGLRLRGRSQAGQISDHGLATATGRLEAEMERLLSQRFRAAANRRLAAHLRHEQPHLFTFLRCPGLEATNHEAERAIRVLVIARKVWGGNRTEQGARTQAVLMSLLRSCRQQGKAGLPRLVSLLRAPTAVVLDVVPDSS